MSVKYEEHLKLILAPVVIFMALVGSVILFSVADKPQEHPQQASFYMPGEAKIIYVSGKSGSPSSLALLTGAPNSRSEIAVLDNDQDHDGNYDGMADPLAALSLAFLVAFCMPFILGLSAGSRLLLAFCEPPILVSSDYYLALEQPD